MPAQALKKISPELLEDTGMALSARRSLLLLLAAIVSHDGLAATWAASARVRMLAPPAARALADGSGAARRAVVVRMMAGGAKSKGPKKAAVGKRGTKKGGEGFSKSPEAADAEQLAQFAEKAGAVAARVAAPAVAAAPRVQLFGGPFMRIELAVWQSLRLPREASNQAVLEVRNPHPECPSAPGAPAPAAAPPLARPPVGLVGGTRRSLLAVDPHARPAPPLPTCPHSSPRRCSPPWPRRASSRLCARTATALSSASSSG
jgi:hypothetical protein